MILKPEEGGTCENVASTKAKKRQKKKANQNVNRVYSPRTCSPVISMYGVSQSMGDILLVSKNVMIRVDVLIASVLPIMSLEIILVSQA